MSTTASFVRLLKYAPSPGADPFVPFYTIVRRATRSIEFGPYATFIESVFKILPTSYRKARDDASKHLRDDLIADQHHDNLCFDGTVAYDKIREATEVFLGIQASLLEDCCNAPDVDFSKLSAGTSTHDANYNPFLVSDSDATDVNSRFDTNIVTRDGLRSLLRRLFDRPAGSPTPNGMPDDALTFMRQIAGNEAGLDVHHTKLGQHGSGFWSGLIRCKLRCPPLLELIWSYWMEQGMLVQGANALTLRFQNRMPPGRGALTRCDLSPLRPLNNILWGYVQAENDRLSVVRRAYEYDHHYGLRLQGRAVPPLAPADSRTQFIESFHRLLMEAYRYIRTSMDTTMNVDAFPVLNCLKELHLILAEGAHNQFGDLPSTARAEMLIQQWIFARPEVRDFLGGRPGVPYPEPWMPNVETLRQMMGWADTTIRHYRDLAVFGEQLLLAVRYLPWSTETDAQRAAAWVTFWRPEIQQYLHAYRAVTGVELMMDDVRVHNPAALFAQPSDLIRRRRIAAARVGALPSANGNGNGHVPVRRGEVAAPAAVARLQ